MSVRTVKISNVSLGASERDIKEFFSFSGEIECVEMESGNEWSQLAYVTFRDPQGAETALHLTGATIVDMPVVIALAEGYQPPVAASAPTSDVKAPSGAEGVVQKAEDVASTVLAKGFVLGKDVLNRAKTFDEKHQLTSTASAKVVSIDQKMGLSEKVSIGTSAVSEKVSIGTSAVSEKMKEMDQKFQVSDKTKSAFAAAEQSVTNAGSAVMKNRYVLTGATWVTGAFNRVAKAAEDVGSKTVEKVTVEEEHKRGTTESSSDPKTPDT